MSRKHDPPPDHHRPPAMFVGDELPESRFAVWLDLDDPETAGRDAKSNRLLARLRRWLRRVLRIRVA